jgi:hypothetical protein
MIVTYNCKSNTKKLGNTTPSPNAWLLVRGLTQTREPTHRRALTEACLWMLKFACMLTGTECRTKSDWCST